MTTLSLNYTGAIRTFTVPTGVFSIDIKLWGAGGAGSLNGYGSTGGAGGYASGTLSVVPGQVLSIIVGQGGTLGNASAIPNPSTFGGGGAGGLDGTVYIGGAGGGRSAVRIGTSELITAAGGGGAASYTFGTNSNGGNGGGLTGNNGTISGAFETNGATGGYGATQLAGGAGATTTVTLANGNPGSQFQGGQGGTGQGGQSGGGGGGGGGYYGGGGGAGEAIGNGYPQETAAGGGSSYIGGVMNGVTSSSVQLTTANANALPPNTTDPNYITGVGKGGITNAAGGNGLVILNYNPIPLSVTKVTNKTFGSINDVIDYTMVLTNISGTTIPGTIFQDTLPNYTTYVNNSFTINGVSQGIYSLTPPGVNLPDLSANQVMTIKYSTIVTSLPPTVTIANVATAYSTSIGTINSNIVTTSVVQSIITPVKSVSENYGMVNDILTYTIVLTNTGNTAANNLKITDTLPSGVTYVANSFKQDATNVVATFPIVTLPNSIPVNGVSTVTFKVTVTSVPTPNPIDNSVLLNYSYVFNNTTVPNVIMTSSIVSNSVLTTIANVNLSNLTKIVSNNFTTSGAVLTYTFTVRNTGNITANNVILIDTIPSGTTFIANSVQINGTSVSGNPQTGILIGDIPANDLVTIIFIVKVN